MDIDTILSRGNFFIPFFAEFILDKYGDIRHTDPDAARKIERKVFSQKFITAIFEGENSTLKSRVLREVDAQCFAAVADKVEYYYWETDYIGGKASAGRVLAAINPEAFRKMLEDRCESYLNLSPCTVENFYWMEYLPDLGIPQKNACFERALALFRENREHLSQSERFSGLSKALLVTALELEHADAEGLGTQYLELLAQTVDREEENWAYEFCFELFYSLAPKINGRREDFELELYFDLEEDRIGTWPDLLDGVYGTGPQNLGIRNSFQRLIQAKGDPEPLSLLSFTPQNESAFLGRFIKTLSRSPEIKSCLARAGLLYPVTVVFNALLWQLNRNEAFSPAAFSDEALLLGLTVDKRPLPFWDRIRAHIGAMAAPQRENFLESALAAVRDIWEETGSGFHGVENVFELTAAFPSEAFFPALIDSFLWDSDEAHDDFYDTAVQAAAAFGDRCFDALDPLMEELPSVRCLSLLDLIRKVASPRAEAFLITHFDLFTEAFRSDTLDACQSLVSRKALDLVAHKVGKGQRGIDELWVLVKTFEGDDGPEVRSVLERIRSTDELCNEVAEHLDSDRPAAVLDLELTCACCGDTNQYECRNIILSPRGGAYVAEELTCINCGEICEFELTSAGLMVIDAEIIRMISRHDGTGESLPEMGAVRIMPTAVMGREMSITEGIALYKEKIGQQPRNPEHSIGLGNIYRGCNQYHFARKQYEKALENGPFYIEVYLSMAEMAYKAGKLDSALAWLEKGRPFLSRPLICKDIQVTPDEILDTYLKLHFDLLLETGAKLAPIRKDECLAQGLSPKKVGRNEKCPCGSGKKYKKCCMKKL